MKRTAALVGANLGRLLLAATFLLSGGTKIIDPRGCINKLGDYTVALGIAQWTPGFVLTAVGIALAVAETVLGVYHLFGIRRRFTISITIATLAVMTALTVWLVLTGRLIDCGCFGDVWVMSNEQSLAKNVILLCISLCLAWKWRLVWKVVSVRWQWIVSLPAVAACIVVALWSFYTLPLIDLGPYKQGTDLRQALQSDDPRYADLYIEDTDGNDITEAWLSQDGPALLLVMTYVEKADEGFVFLFFVYYY